MWVLCRVSSVWGRGYHIIGTPTLACVVCVEPVTDCLHAHPAGNVHVHSCIIPRLQVEIPVPGNGTCRHKKNGFSAVQRSRKTPLHVKDVSEL